MPVDAGIFKRDKVERTSRRNIGSRVAGMVALVWAPDAFQLAAWMRNAVAWSLTVLGWMVPLAAAVVLMVRKKYDKRYKRKEDGVS